MHLKHFYFFNALKKKSLFLQIWYAAATSNIKMADGFIHLLTIIQLHPHGKKSAPS